MVNWKICIGTEGTLVLSTASEPSLLNSYLCFFWFLLLQQHRIEHRTQNTVHSTPFIVCVLISFWKMQLVLAIASSCKLNSSSNSWPLQFQIQPHTILGRRQLCFDGMSSVVCSKSQSQPHDDSLNSNHFVPSQQPISIPRFALSLLDYII